jgi:hypothetical protein
MRGVKSSLHTNGSDKKILPPESSIVDSYVCAEWNEDTGTYFYRDANVSSTRNATDPLLTRRILDEDIASIHFLSSKPVKNNTFAIHHEVL